jgi:8-oxo-dGTP pyrophosphatase MutT (NUDIX family)
MNDLPADPRPADPDRTDAAVLVPVYRSAGGEIRLVLVRRSEWGIHGGQIALPGGTFEPGDRSLLQTALREAHEEIGLPAANVHVLEELPPVETTTSRFRIVPYLARVRPPPAWRCQEREIVEVMEVPVRDLEHADVIDPAPGDHESEREKHPLFRLGSDVLWGATYRIVQPLITRLQSGEWAI